MHYSQRQLYLLFAIAVIHRSHAFIPIGRVGSSISSIQKNERISLKVEKGFGTTNKGGSGFGSKNNINKKSPSTTGKLSKDAVLKKISKVYGGTTARDIAAGTQKKIQYEMQNLSEHLQKATQLYQKLRMWNARVATLSIIQLTNISQEDLDGAKRAQDELDSICTQHNLTMNDLHNIFQKMTWDASADAKAARAITGTMPPEITQRIDKACRIVGETVRLSKNPKPRCLDVGCGFGVLVPYLMKSGELNPSEIYGVDLSSEMIRNAHELYPEINFEAIDFLDEYCGPKDGDGLFDSIIVCSTLHDLPDIPASLKKALSLIRPNGTLVIVHAQGAAHVDKQVESNPVLVKRGLPSVLELNELGIEMGFILEVAPAAANTPGDVSHGYLSVLRKNELLE